MPVKFGLWRVDGKSVEQVPTSGIASEERLEDILGFWVQGLSFDVIREAKHECY
jgi:hypothetical protein